MALAAALAGCAPENQPDRARAKAENLFINARDKEALRRAAVVECVRAGVGDCERISGPLPGMYYGRRGNRFWAIASFRHPVQGVEGQPAMLRRTAGGTWDMVARTGGTACRPLPVPMARVWDLKVAPSRQGGRCFRAPPPQVDVGPSEKVVAAYHSLTDNVVRQVNDYWAQTMPETFGETYRPPVIEGAYTSEDDAPTCAGEALSTNNAAYCIPDNYIAWDEPHLMFPFYQRFGDMAPAMVIAHEFGHAVQTGLDWQFDLSIYAELNADCLAGAWARETSSLKQRGLRATDLDGVVKPLFEFRDPAGSEWFDPDAHGSGIERIAAFQYGTSGDVQRCEPTPENPAGFPGAPMEAQEQGTQDAPTVPDQVPEETDTSPEASP